MAATTLMLYRTVDVYADRTSQLAVESFVSAVLADTADNAELVSSFLTAFLKRFSLALSTLVKQPAAKRYLVLTSISRSTARWKNQIWP
jgi:hypothetical protein